MSSQQTISDVRENLPSIVNNVFNYLNRVDITVRGTTKAVIISVEELESIEETADILATPGMYASIKQGTKEAKKEKGISLSEIIKEHESLSNKASKKATK